jgi:hypothetical protein
LTVTGLGVERDIRGSCGGTTPGEEEMIAPSRHEEVMEDEDFSNPKP